LIIGLRSMLVESGRIPRAISDALQGIFRQGNPLGLGRDSRPAWNIGLNLPAAQAGCEVLYFACCSSAYDARLQPITRALAQVLQLAGVKLGTLGSAETCCGNEVRRVGEQGLFEMLVEEGKPLIQSTGAKQIITTSPHCFNTFKHEYGLEQVEVCHYTQWLAAALQAGQIQLTRPLEKKVTYHDPCFLGKQNHIFAEPRAVLQAIPGLTFVEMDRNRERSLCCEGGGGRMWTEGTNIQVRTAFERVHEAAATGAEILAVACPFCLLTLEDAAKVQKLDLQVRDIMELVSEAL
jgi:Fe-S oxidoreductase